MPEISGNPFERKGKTVNDRNSNLLHRCDEWENLFSSLLRQKYPRPIHIPAVVSTNRFQIKTISHRNIYIYIHVHTLRFELLLFKKKPSKSSHSLFLSHKHAVQN